MCLILLAHRAHPRYPLVLAANRDEFYERPTATATFWADAPDLLAGRDLRAGGTWLGVTRTGRWAAVTNYRDPPAARANRPSRGALVAAFLQGGQTPADYVADVARNAGEYDGFNLLVGDTADACYLGNRDDGPPRRLAPGIYGLSNHLLDTPWPKVVRGRRGLGALLEDGAHALTGDALLALLYDSEIAPDDALPDTGIGAEWERALSASFVVTPSYGTRSSTGIIVDADGRLEFVERSFRPGPTPAGDARYVLEVEPSPAPG